MLDDLRSAVRSLIRRPFIPLASALLLSVGSALATTAFSLLDGAQLRPLAMGDPGALVRLEHVDGSAGFITTTIPAAVRRRVGELPAVQGVGAFAEVVVRESPGEAGAGVMVRVADVEPGLISLLGPSLRLGSPPDVPGTAAISSRVWRNRFGSQPEVVGRRLTFEDGSFTIVAVLADGVGLGRGAEIWRVRDLAGEPASAVVRMAPGIGRAGLAERLDGLAEALGRSGELSPGSELGIADGIVDRPGGLGPMLWVVITAAVLLLAVLAANVASLLVAGGIRRGPEFALRRALGAPRGRIVGSVFLEVGIIVAVSSTIGYLAAHPLMASALAIEFRGTPLAANWPSWLRPEVDLRAFLFTAVSGLLIALASGLSYALHAVRTKPLRELRGYAPTDGLPARSVLVIGQFAGVFTLGVASILLWRSAGDIRDVAVVSGTDRVAEISLSPRDPDAPSGLVDIEVEQALDNLATSLPGAEVAVEAVPGGVRGLPARGERGPCSPAPTTARPGRSRCRQGGMTREGGRSSRDGRTLTPVTERLSKPWSPRRSRTSSAVPPKPWAAPWNWRRTTDASRRRWWVWCALPSGW